MRFWDSSALVPLVVEESSSTACRRLLRAHPRVHAWALSRVEIVSAIRRKAREGALNDEQVETALHRLDLLAAGWTEVQGLGEVRERAERLLGAHPLTSADALQLGAALIACEDRPRKQSFLCRDEGLQKAAAAEGFETIFPR